MSWKYILESLNLIYFSEPIKYRLSNFKDWARDLKLISNDIEKSGYIPLSIRNKYPIIKKNKLSSPNYFSRKYIIDSNISISESEVIKKYKSKNLKSGISNYILTQFSLSLRDALKIKYQQITLESHGRSSEVTLIDPALCLGWLTSIFPIEINYESNKYIDSKNDFEFVKNVKSKRWY